MPIRALTDGERSRLLSQEEVNGLDDGTEVMVKWSGGNGPHRYELESVEGRKYPYVDDTPVNNVSDDPESGLTKVFLPRGED